jgi:hypothetical protein
VAVITDEAGVVVVLLDVIRNDVIVVLAWPGDLRSEFGQAYVRVSPDPPVRDQAIIPVVPPDEVIEAEGVGGRHGKEIAHAGIVIDGKGPVIPVENFERSTAPGEIVLPGLPGEQNPDSPVGINANDCDVPVGFGFEVDPGLFTPAIGVFIAIGPEADTLAFGGANPGGDTAKLEGAGVAQGGAGIGRDGRQHEPE